MTYPPGPGQYPPYQYPPLGGPAQYPGQPQYPAQPQYPGQGFPGQYPPPQPQRKKTGLWIGLAALVVAVVVAVGIGFAVVFSDGGRSSGKPALTGRPQSEYVALLPKQEDFGAGWSVSDDPQDASADSSKAQEEFLSKLTANPPGCGMSDLKDKAKPMLGKSQRLAGVKGTHPKTDSSGTGSQEPTVLTVVLGDGQSYEQGVQPLRDYIAKCSSATMQGDYSENGLSVPMTVKIDFAEVKPPSVQADAVFSAQIKSTISIGGASAGQGIKVELFQTIEAALLRGVVVGVSVNDAAQTGLADKLFTTTVDRVNAA